VRSQVLVKAEPPRKPFEGEEASSSWINEVMWMPRVEYWGARRPNGLFIVSSCSCDFSR